MEEIGETVRYRVRESSLFVCPDSDLATSRGRAEYSTGGTGPTPAPRRATDTGSSAPPPESRGGSVVIQGLDTSIESSGWHLDGA